MEIKTKEDYEKACNEYDAAQRFYTGSEDPEVIKKAGERVSELERAFEDCEFTND